MKEWLEPLDVQVPEALQLAIGGHPLVAQTLARRGLAGVEAALAFLDPDRYRPAPPSDLPNLIGAVERLERAIRQRERVCVWGDFDVDGQTATTILVSTLRDLAVRQGSPSSATVRYHIPVRAQESHGVNLSALKRVIAEGVDLVLTCDTGVTAHEPVAYARSLDVDVVITDHHDLPPALPAACAIVNPKLLPQSHPLRELPGVGCAYKLAEALYERVGRSEDAAQYLDLVALGIVADVAAQVGDVRYLLQRGLEALRHTTRLGLQEVMALAELNPEWLTEEHIGFELAPRLNALGRLADANPAVDLLTTADVTRARTLATELEGLNAQRKLQCDQVFQAAQAQIEREPALLDNAVLVLSHPTWPGGVIGVVAGRLAERYSRPTILIAVPPGERGRGSARSVEGCNITAAIAAHAEMLHTFGGHPMAAGLSIDAERIPEFRRALSRTVAQMCGEVPKISTLQIDAYLPLSDLSLDLVEEIERLAPFGQGNPPLTLASRDLSLVSYAAVGRSGEHLQVIVEDGRGATQRVIWWRGAGEPLPEGRFDLAYTVRASDYRGQRDVQVEWIDAREHAREDVAGRRLRVAGHKFQIVDYRQVDDPRKVLAQLRAQEDVLVWGEGGDKADVAGHDRGELGPAKVLAIWTAPPGPVELRAALECVSPERVCLFGTGPGLDDVEGFLRRLIGLVKRVLKADEGRVSVSTLAAATAQREATVRAGLAWLVARGHISLLGEDGDRVHLAAGGGEAGDDLFQVTVRLKALLEETAAYRAYFQRADKDSFFA